MAKQSNEKSEQKINLYLLAIVAIVAIVGIVVLVLNVGTDLTSVSEEDLTGEAYATTYSEVSGVKTGCKCGADSSGFCNPCPKK